MIQLVRPEKSPFADELESIFQGLVLAYRRKFVEDDGLDDSDRPSTPYILDGNRKIDGEKAIRSWVRELERELSIQRSVSGDGCYVDPDSGETC